MKKTSFAGAAVAATIAIAGCSALQARAVAKECNTDSDCGVTVVVTKNSGSSGPACTIASVQDIVAKKNKKPEIVWTIQNNGGGQFKFAQGMGAVALKSGTWDTAIFDDKGSQNGTQYRIKDKNNKKKNPGDSPDTYEYKITVVKPDDSFGCVLDPILINDGCEAGSC